MNTASRTRRLFEPSEPAARSTTAATLAADKLSVLAFAGRQHKGSCNQSCDRSEPQDTALRGR